MRKILTLLALVGLLAGCSKNADNKATLETNMTHETLTQEQVQAVMDEVSALGTPTMEADEVAVIETKFGRMVIEFDIENSPIHAANFKKLAEAGYYDGITFHRIIPGFMIQGGDINSRDDDPTNDGMGGPGYTVGAEIHSIHKRGAIAAARTGNNINPERRSSGSQFFICHVDIPHLDGEYTVYGKIIEGIEVVDKIAEVNTGPGDRPLEDVVMDRVYFTTKSEL